MSQPPLRINGALIMGMVEHAYRNHPVEACGILAGPVGGDPQSCWEMRNALRSPTAYAFDPDDELRAYAKMDQLGWDPLVIYHSHTASAAVPSRYDHAHAWERKATYVIISTATDEPVVRAYRRTGYVLAEVPIVIPDEC